MQDLMTARRGIVGLAFGLSIVAAAASAHAEQQPAATTDADYLAKVMTAAPEQIVKAATIVSMDKGAATRTLQRGTNDFTCMVGIDGTPMCTDKNGMEWVRARMNHSSPPDKIGFMYMLGGDNGASSIDPFATQSTPDNHWVKTGPHVMILGAAVKSLGYARTPEANPTQPYVMWPGTPYEHVMLPVK